MKKKFVAVLLAGALLMPGGKAFANENVNVERVFGNNRYETATMISQKYYEKSQAVVIASGEIFPDALVGSTLTIQKEWPLLLTKSSKLDENTKEELKRLKPEKVYILGGNKTITLDVERELSKDYKVERIYGDNRYETAEKIGKLRKDLLGKEVKKDDIINYVVSGEDYPDALSAAPLAGRPRSEDSLAILNLASSTKGIENPVIVGGEKSVKGDETRIHGKDRYITSLEVAKEYKKVFGGFDTVVLASGLDFPDALSASSVAAKLNAPIVLTGKQIDKELLSYVKENSKKIVVVGGDMSVSEDNLMSMVYGKDSSFYYALEKMPKEIKTDISHRRAFTGNEKVDILDLFNEANEVYELSRVIDKEEAMKVLGLEDGEYDEQVLSRAAAYKLGSNANVEAIVNFIKDKDVKKSIDEMALGLVANNEIKASKSGDISDPFVALNMGREFLKNIISSDNDVFRAGVETILKNETTGFNIVSEKYKNDFDKDKTFVYSHDSIKHVHQLLALLRMEGIEGKVAIEPKSSAYEYKLEWGPIGPATDRYEVVKVKDDKYVANSLEFNIYIEFKNVEDMAKLDRIVKENATKTESDPDGLTMIDGAWWVPLYSTSAEMGEEYGKLVDNTVSKDGLVLHSFTTEEASEKIINTLNEILKSDKAKAETIYVNNSFIDYLLED